MDTGELLELEASDRCFYIWTVFRGDAEYFRQVCIVRESKVFKDMCLVEYIRSDETNIDRGMYKQQVWVSKDNLELAL